MVKDLIKIENKGRSTYVSVAGIGIEKALKGVSFDQSAESVKDPSITVNIEIKEMLKVLAEVTPEQIEEAKEIIKPYLDGYRKDVAEEFDRKQEEAIRAIHNSNSPEVN